MKKISEIQTFDDFKQAMTDGEFQMRLQFALQTFVSIIDGSDNPEEYVVGADEKIIRYWLKYSSEGQSINPGLYKSQTISR